MTSQTSRNLLATTGLIAIGFAAAMAPAAAANKTLCKTYATKAVGQYTKMLSRGMGCSGPRWSGWWTGHYNWCRIVNKHTAKSEYYIRRNSLNGWTCL